MFLFKFGILVLGEEMGKGYGKGIRAGIMEIIFGKLLEKRDIWE